MKWRKKINTKKKNTKCHSCWCSTTVSIQTYPLYSYVSHTVYQGSSPTCIIIMNPSAKIQKLKESHQNQCVKTNQLSEYHTGEVIICKKKFFFHNVVIGFLWLQLKCNCWIYFKKMLLSLFQMFRLEMKPTDKSNIGEN